MFLKYCLLSSIFISNLPETFALHLSIFEDGAHYDFNDKYITSFGSSILDLSEPFCNAGVIYNAQAKVSRSLAAIRQLA